MANIVNLNAICAIATCHYIYYSIILTFNGNYQKIQIFINWFLNITEAFFENLRMEGYMQTCVIFYRKLPNPEVYHTFFWIQKHWAFKKNTMRVCPYDWYQLAKFWLLADRLLCNYRLIRVNVMRLGQIKTCFVHIEAKNSHKLIVHLSHDLS